MEEVSKSEFKFRDSQTFFELMRRYDHWTRDMELCDQCKRPWNDKVCTCEGSGDRLVKSYAELGKNLIASGKDLSKYSADIDFSTIEIS